MKSALNPLRRPAENPRPPFFAIATITRKSALAAIVNHSIAGPAFRMPAGDFDGHGWEDRLLKGARIPPVTDLGTLSLVLV